MSCGSPRQFLECASLLVFWRIGDGGEPTKSARGLAQSKTLPRNPQVAWSQCVRKAAEKGLPMNLMVTNRTPPGESAADFLRLLSLLLLIEERANDRESNRHPRSD